MNAILAALLALQFLTAPVSARCGGMFFGELPENGAILDVTEVGLMVLVFNHDSVGIMRWLDSENNEVLTKMPLPKNEEVILMKLLYDDGSELLVSVITCSGTLYYMAFRVWYYKLDYVPPLAA